MKIILNKDVQNLGEEGDVREVAPGYARNYLIPKGLGVTYTKQNLALLDGKRKAIEKRKEEKKQHAAGLKERIEALNLQITMTVGENGRLFGSVTNAMIAEELAKLGIEIERKRIEIPEHTIKNTGNFVVKVKLYGSEVASLKVAVAGPSGAQQVEAPSEEATPAGEEPAEAAAEAAATPESAAENAEPEAPEAADEAAASEAAVSEATETETVETASEPADESAGSGAAEAEEAETEEATEEHAGETTEEPADEASAPEEAAGEEPATDEPDEESADRE